MLKNLPTKVVLGVESFPIFLRCFGQHAAWLLCLQGLGGHYWPTPAGFSPVFRFLPSLEDLKFSQYSFLVWAAFQGIAIGSGHSSSILNTCIFEFKQLSFPPRMVPKDSQLPGERAELLPRSAKRNPYAISGCDRESLGS